jgi:hypothetical protein
MCLVFVLQNSFGNGLINNQMMGPLHIAASGNRGATVDQPDAAAYNPAGTAWLADGWYIQLTNATVFQTRNSYSPSLDKNWGLEATIPVYPTYTILKKQGSWAFFTYMHYPGSFGSLVAKESPLLESTVYNLAEFFNAKDYSIKESDVNLSGGVIGWATGASWRLHPKISIAGVARYLYAINSLRANYSADVGIMEFEGGLATEITGGGWNYSLGAHIVWNEKWQMGFSWNTPTTLKMKTETTKDSLLSSFSVLFPLYPSGMTLISDVPAYGTLGVRYKHSSLLELQSSWHFYHQNRAGGGLLDSAEAAKFGSLAWDPTAWKRAKQVKHGHGIGLASIWHLQDFSWIASVNYNYVGATKEWRSTVSDGLNAVSVGGGLIWRINSAMSVTFATALPMTIAAWGSEAEPVNDVKLSSKTKIFAIGLDLFLK